IVTRSAAWSATGTRSTEQAATSLRNIRNRAMAHLQSNVGLQKLVVFADEDGGAEDGGPQAALVADGRLRDVEGADDFVGDAVDLFFLVPRKIRIKFDVEGGREHFGGELFGVFAGDFFGFAEGMMLGEIAIHGFVAGKSEADAGGN